MATVIRKGATTIAAIPPEILAQLNTGAIETVNLTEWLAIDHRQLLQAVLPSIALESALTPALEKIAQIDHPTVAKIIPAIAQILLPAIQRRPNAPAIIAALATHRADSVRCWAAYLVSLQAELPIDQKLTDIRPFAADHHFGVREIAWMAVRPDITSQLLPALASLTTWATAADANIRRFASEATRPRGVWCKHITALKQQPELALPILEPLCSDGAKYVRDSVGNWLNDASKSQPDWVRITCDRWQQQSPTKETQYIVKRGQRSLG
jgi:3-methyladenine DNA glycosylase AlkC